MSERLPRKRDLAGGSSLKEERASYHSDAHRAGAPARYENAPRVLGFRKLTHLFKSERRKMTERPRRAFCCVVVLLALLLVFLLIGLANSYIYAAAYYAPCRIKPSLDQWMHFRKFVQPAAARYQQLDPAHSYVVSVPSGSAERRMLQCTERDPLAQFYFSRESIPSISFSRYTLDHETTEESVRMGKTIVVATGDSNLAYSLYSCEDEPNATVPYLTSSRTSYKNPSVTHGCSFFCVDPLLVGGAAEGSYDVNVRDLEAGLIEVDGRVLTKDDLFECRTITPTEPDNDKGLKEYLLSADVWLTQFGEGLPFLWTDKVNATVKHRLLPLHTAFIYGESFIGFSDYVLRSDYLDQFDEVMLLTRTNPLSQKQLLDVKERRDVSDLPLRNPWSFAHTYKNDFELILHLNRRQREQPSRDGASSDVTREGFLAHTAGLYKRHLSQCGVPYTLPQIDPVKGERALNRTKRSHALAEKWQSRESAIAVFISNCHHNRMAWLDELSKYYPVHNYGHCTSSKLPNPPHLQVLWHCRRKQLIRDLWNNKFEFPVYNQSSYSHEGKSAPHRFRDYELRSVFQRYKYVMAFENTVEEDYVTEKVYNALLSGAVPIYIGSPNITDYIPTPDSVIDALKLFPLLDEVQWQQEKARVLSTNRDQVDQVVSAAKRFHLAENTVAALAAQHHTHHSATLSDLTIIAAANISQPLPVSDYTHFFAADAPIYTLLKRKTPSPSAMKKDAELTYTVQLPNRLYVLPLDKQSGGFRGLGSYLRQLETNSEKVHQHFSWWDALEMKDWSASFQEKIYRSHFCGMCAKALQKRRNQ